MKSGGVGMCDLKRRDHDGKYSGKTGNPKNGKRTFIEKAREGPGLKKKE
jgi:hypothetical protein